MDAREQIEMTVQKVNTAIFHLALVASAYPDLTVTELPDVRASRDKLTEILIALLPRKVA